MSNSYYNHGSYPTTGAPGASASLRSELDSITSGFNLLPTISGNGSKAVIVNSGATALSVTTGTLALAGNFATTGAYNTTLIQGATTSLTLPLVSGTLATLAGTEEFTNKTLTSAVAKGTWTASGTWTLPALTLGGAITYGGVTLSNAVTGTNNMVLSASPTLTGTIAAASQTLSGTFGVTGVATFTAQPIMSSLTASKPVFTDASKGLTSTGTLAYDQGGTGQTSYAAGDIIYASGVNTLTKLAIGTTGQHLIVSGGVPSWSTDATIGTVTSVGWTGGIVSVATATTTPAFTIAGTSGGVPYFDSGTTWATSAALAANALVLGGGAGAAPSTTTTGTGVVTALGVNTGTAGAFVVNGGALGTPSSGTVTNLTGTASININGTVGATTPAAGSFTTLSASSTSTMAAINASGTVAMAGAATVGTTLGVTGTSTMAAINASGNISINSGVILLTAATGAINTAGALTLAPASANPQITLTDVTKGSGYIQGGVNTGGTGAGDYWIFNVPTSRGLSWAVNNSTVLNAVAAGVSIPGTLSVTGTSTMAAINASGSVTLSGTSFFRSPTTSNTPGTFNFYLAASGIREGTAGDFNIDTYNGGWGARLTVSQAGAVTIPGTLGVTGNITGSGADGFKTGANNTGLYFNGSRNAILGSNAADTVTIAAANANVAVFGAASTSLTGTLGVTGATTLSAQTTFGERAYLNSTGRISVAGATTIYAIANSGASVGSSATLVLVNGYLVATPTNSFIDLVLFMPSGVPMVISSINRGVPAVRTYTSSGANLQLAMASGTYNVANSNIEQAC